VENAVELSKVSRSFGRLRALDTITLEVPAGTSTALMGPNGAGKTTLLKLCATLLSPTSGKLRVLGLDPSRDGVALRARIAVLGHDSHLYGDLSAHENLLFSTRLYGIDDAPARIEASLERLGLRADARRPVRTFSRGMQQRCALARVLLLRPRLLLLDEPATGLDVAARAALYEIVRDLHRDGTTVLVTTHDVAESRQICQQAVLLTKGRLAWSGSIEGAAALDLEARLQQAVDGGRG
jgi:ABC-type multidrug transport system ATPase subunit